MMIVTDRAQAFGSGFLWDSMVIGGGASACPQMGVGLTRLDFQLAGIIDRHWYYFSGLAHAFRGPGLVNYDPGWNVFSHGSIDSRDWLFIGLFGPLAIIVVGLVMLTPSKKTILDGS